MIIVISGPGGVGKGTVVKRLLRRDDRLWLSRSWTTRPPRPGESDDAYVFTDVETFERHRDRGGFLEWAEFMGHLYGTPLPDELPAGRDLVLEIDVQGAEQVRQRFPEALLVLLVAPSREAQAARLEGRGDRPDQVARRLEKADQEVAMGRKLGAVEVVNDELDRTVGELVTLIDEARGRSSTLP
jgi:guanylate kinase